MVKILTFFCCLVCSWIYADNLPQWHIVPQESKLTFTATQNDAPISGEFKKFSGTILVDPAQYEKSKLDIIVDMNSLSASYNELVTTLITDDWFNVKKFPTAEFTATEFKKIAENTYEAHGSLTIRDKTVPVILTFTATEVGKDKGLVEGKTILKRNAFGVGQGEWSSTDDVKDDVVVNFRLIAIKKD